MSSECFYLPLLTAVRGEAADCGCRGKRQGAMSDEEAFLGGRPNARNFKKRNRSQGWAVPMSCPGSQLGRRSRRSPSIVTNRRAISQGQLRRLADIPLQVGGHAHFQLKKGYVRQAHSVGGHTLAGGNSGNILVFLASVATARLPHEGERWGGKRYPRSALGFTGRTSGPV